MDAAHATAMAEAAVRVFILRLWLEPPDEPDGDPEWRGEIRDVMTARVAYFRHRAGIVEALRRVCTDPGAGPPPSR